MNESVSNIFSTHTVEIIRSNFNLRAVLKTRLFENIS